MTWVLFLGTLPIQLFLLSSSQTPSNTLSSPSPNYFPRSRDAPFRFFSVCVGLLLPNHWTDLHKNYTSR